MSLRILHIAMGHPEFDRCGRELGHEVERIQGRDNPMGYYALQGHILHRASLFMPGLVFIQSHETEVVFPETLDALRELGAFVVFWVGDVRDPIPAYYDRVAPHVDVIAFSNMTDVEEMRSRGHRSEYLQIAVDETFYTPGDPRERKGVVFLGNNYVDRFPNSRLRAKVVELMRREFGSLFRVYGNGWGHGTSRTIPEQEREIYRSALIALNVDHFTRPHFASDRILRAQACGCLVYSLPFDEEVAKENPRVRMCSHEGAGLSEMVGSIRLTLDFAQRYYENHGGKAAAHTREHHTWRSRINTMEQWLSSKGPSA